MSDAVNTDIRKSVGCRAVGMPVPVKGLEQLPVRYDWGYAQNLKYVPFWENLSDEESPFELNDVSGSATIADYRSKNYLEIRSVIEDSNTIVNFRNIDIENFINCLFQSESREESFLLLEKGTSEEYSEKIVSQIDELFNDIMDDEDPEQEEISFESMITMFAFLLKNDSRVVPIISVDVNGLFHCKWYFKKDDSLLVVFGKNRICEYLLMETSQFLQKRKQVVSGSGHV